MIQTVDWFRYRLVMICRRFSLGEAIPRPSPADAWGRILKSQVNHGEMRAATGSGESRGGYFIFSPPKLAAISEFRIILLRSSGKGQPENFQNAPNPGIPLRHVAMSHGDQNMVNDRRRRLRTGAIDETRKLFGIFIYLWVLLSLFSFHKALVLNEEYLIYDQGFALINALAVTIPRQSRGLYFL